MPKMLGIKPLFKTVYRKLCGRLSIKPVCKELAHPGCWNVDCDLLAVPNSRPPDPLQEGRQRIIILIKLKIIIFQIVLEKRIREYVKQIHQYSAVRVLVCCLCVPCQPVASTALIGQLIGGQSARIVFIRCP